MRNDVAHSSAQVDRFILETLHEVRETVASGIEVKKYSTRTFGINDLWNIRRKAKFATARLRK